MPVVDASATTRCAPVGTPAAAMTSLANALEPSSRAAAADRAEAAHALGGERVGEPGDERRLGPDDHEVDRRLARPRGRVPRRRRRARRAAAASRRMPALPGAHSSSGAWGERAQRADERVLAPAGADDEDPHTAPMKSSIGIAGSDS